ncbi:haloacid dehalogenase-like hydrolase [Streptomyces sp. SID11385]|uniref:HAD family hydrolase n=1 Tax=Streptomyces sp. SID11385 TaxID=2706031 RepID=UPI0013C92CDD|nr:haloacid dehalogenase-like hydrolase [Streptomyces sp. SID11385]NEA38421.1 HAD hydrolase family protein [Streptomyces sp. SID11385]
MPAPRAAGAVFFDVDGTLVPGTSSSAHLAASLGHLGGLVAAEEAYARGEVDNRRVAELDARGWRGASEGEVAGLLRTLPLVAGIAETVAWCRGQGLVPVLATLAWTPVGAYLAERFGFRAYDGPRPARAGGRYTGRVARHFDEHDKRDAALARAAALGLAPTACAAIGDSRSDLPLFAAAGLSIAFNGSAHARAAADHAVEGADLRAVLPVLEVWRGR